MKTDIYFVLTGVTTPTGGREQLGSFLNKVMSDVEDTITIKIKVLNGRDTKTLEDYFETETLYDTIFYQEYNRAVDIMKNLTEKFTGINLEALDVWKLDRKYFTQFGNFQQHMAVVTHNLMTLRTTLLGIFEESR